MNTSTLLKIVGVLGTAMVAGGAGAGMSASGSDTVDIISVVVGVLAGGGLGTVGAAKFAQLREFLKQISEALVAMGLAGLASTSALEETSPGGVAITAEERAEIAEKSRVIIKEYEHVWQAALKLIGRSK